MTTVNLAKRPIDFTALAAFRKTMPPLPKPSAALIRGMRDDERC